MAEGRTGEGKAGATGEAPVVLEMRNVTKAFGSVKANDDISITLLLLWRTRRGFQIRAVGFSPGVANYAGMGIGVNTVLALAGTHLDEGLGRQ